MNIQEAIKWQEAFKRTCKGAPKEVDVACDMAINALEEIQQYRSIGTVEECRAAVEKQRAKKPILSAPCKSINYYLCPNCGKILPINKPFCSECGSAVDWSDI